MRWTLLPALAALSAAPGAPEAPSALTRDDLVRIERAVGRLHVAAEALETTARAVESDGRLHSVHLLRTQALDVQTEVQTVHSLVRSLTRTTAPAPVPPDR